MLIGNNLFISLRSKSFDPLVLRQTKTSDLGLFRRPAGRAAPSRQSRLTWGESSNYVSQGALLGAQWSMASSASRGRAFPGSGRDSGQGPSPRGGPCWAGKTTVPGMPHTSGAPALGSSPGGERVGLKSCFSSMETALLVARRELF